MSGYDEQELSTNKIPRLYGQENYIKWKVLFKAAVCYNDVEMWTSIKNGPYVVDGTNNPNVEARMKKVDDRALAMLKLGLSLEILTKLAHHTTAKAMYDALLEMFEGNTELKNIKKERLKQQLDQLKYKDGERLKSILERFLTIVNEIRTTDYVVTDSNLNTMLLSSSEIEMIENEMIASVAKNMIHTSVVQDDLKQIDVDDLEDTDLKWQAAMLALRSKRLYNGTGRLLISGPNYRIGFDKSKAICYNCQSPSHFSRECNLPRQFNNNQGQQYQPRNQNQFQNHNRRQQ
ncbi:uncharacterized protein LOC143576790 [Bidens hawaiensis]|uniref:uncharacterized protein LOC143576790 n=1 Tax=Bidens hawaiensis TaxID=980011 RepID=UPI00404A8BF6